MRIYNVFEDFGGDYSRLVRPGYWQKQVADDLIFAPGLLQADWHPGRLQNRCGFALSPHFPHPHESTPTVRSWTAEKTAESVLICGLAS